MGLETCAAREAALLIHVHNQIAAVSNAGYLRPGTISQVEAAVQVVRQRPRDRSRVVALIGVWLMTPLSQLGRTPFAGELGAFSVTSLQRLAESDPANAAWQRDLWVSYWRVANVLEQLGSPEAKEYWRKAHDKLADMVMKRLFVSPQDKRFLQQLSAKLRL